jgi:hypothetical protein
MTTQQTNGRRRPSRPDRDPDRRPTPDPHVGFWPLTDVQALLVCGRCACPVPATERAQQVHRSWHEQLAGLEDSRPR